MKSILIATSILFLSGCSMKTKMASIAGVLGAGVGASGGYLLLHHGKNREHELTNTIISASVLSLVSAGLTYWHYSSLEEQRINLASQFSKGELLQTVSSGNSYSHSESVNRGWVHLDNDTRWILPEFNKRLITAQQLDDELVSSHTSWAIGREGYFINRDQDPEFFKQKEKK